MTLRDIAASPYFVLRCTVEHMQWIVMACSTLATWNIITTAFNDTTEIWHEKLKPRPGWKRLAHDIPKNMKNMKCVSTSSFVRAFWWDTMTYYARSCKDILCQIRRGQVNLHVTSSFSKIENERDTKVFIPIRHGRVGLNLNLFTILQLNSVLRLETNVFWISELWRCVTQSYDRICGNYNICLMNF